MKSFSWVLSLVLFVGLSLSAHCTQADTPTLKIDCQFVDLDNKDHLLMELNSDQQGSLYYAIDSEHHQPSIQAAGKMPMKRATSNHLGKARWAAHHDEAKMTVDMPTAMVSKSSDSFESTLTTEIPGLKISNEQDLLCSSHF